MINRLRLLRPFPQFDEVNTTTNEGYSWYHSLQVNMNKRFSKGYTLGLNYTFSKFMQATEFLNGDDPRPHEIISDSDRPHRFSLSGIYELPFGKGRKFFADVNKAASYVISGWQISGSLPVPERRAARVRQSLLQREHRGYSLSTATSRRWTVGSTPTGFWCATAISRRSNGTLRTFPIQDLAMSARDHVNNCRSLGD